MNIPENIEYFNAHSHCLNFSQNVLTVVNLFPENAKPIINNIRLQNIFFSVGLHPWFMKNKEDATEKINEIKILAENTKISAIGECGIDKIKKTQSLEIQTKYFIEQAKIAEQHKKPLIIHSVKANSEIISLRKTLHPKNIWIIHGFCGNTTEAEQFIKNDFFLSLGPRFIKNEKNNDTINQIPSNAILLENDDSGHDICDIYEMVARLKKTDTETIKKIICANFAKIFSLNSS